MPTSSITKQFYVKDKKAFEKLLRACAQAPAPLPPARDPLEAGRIALQNFVLHFEQDPADRDDLTEQKQENPPITDMTDDEKIDYTAQQVLERFKPAFEELAK